MSVLHTRQAEPVIIQICRSCHFARSTTAGLGFSGLIEGILIRRKRVVKCVLPLIFHFRVFRVFRGDQIPSSGFTVLLCYLCGLLFNSGIPVSSPPSVIKKFLCPPCLSWHPFCVFRLFRGSNPSSSFRVVGLFRGLPEFSLSAYSAYSVVIKSPVPFHNFSEFRGNQITYKYGSGLDRFCPTPLFMIYP